MTQERMILGHLERHGTITSFEAFEKYHVTRLAAIIHRLRKKVDIRTIRIYGYDSYGNFMRYAMYELKDEPHGTANTARLDEGERFDDIFPSEDNTLI